MTCFMELEDKSMQISNFHGEWELQGFTAWPVKILSFNVTWVYFSGIHKVLPKILNCYLHNSLYNN